MIWPSSSTRRGRRANCGGGEAHPSFRGDAHDRSTLRRRLEPGDRTSARRRRPGPRALARHHRPPGSRDRVGAYSGRFDAERLFEALAEFRIENLAAAPTVYRLLRDSGLASRHPFRPRKLSYTGEPMDSSTFEWIERTWGLRPCGMYGSTEVGVIIADYPASRITTCGRERSARPCPAGTWRSWTARAAAPGGTDRRDRRAPQGRLVLRQGPWLHGRDGYFHHAGARTT